MPDFHRFYIPNSIIFITSVTENRRPYLKESEDIKIFWEVLNTSKKIHPFSLLAYVILPDHFHFLISLPEPSDNFSTVVHSIKRNFTIEYKKCHSITTSLKLWQSRFWDHVIRNQEDLSIHFDYIHWNPVKHGYVSEPNSWIQSSYLDWVDRGYYEKNWRNEGVTVSLNE